MRRIGRYIWMILAFSLILYGCAGTRKLGEGQKLYTGAEIDIRKLTEGDQGKIRRSLK